jgi:hypothetical protein
MILIPAHKNKATYWYIYMWYTCFDVFTIHQSSVLAQLSLCSGYLFLFVRTSMAICSCLGAASHIKSCLVDRRSERKMFRSRMYCWGIDQGPQIDRFLVVFFVCKTFNRNKVVPPVISKLAKITPLCFVADISLLIHGGNINQQYHHSSLQLVFNCTMWGPPVISWFINPINYS